MGRKAKEDVGNIDDNKIPTMGERLKKYLKERPDLHYCGDDIDYTVSSGSLNFDIETGGGIHPGVVRWSGVTEGGKTSANLAFMKNFLETTPNSMGVYFKSEGRLGENIRERSGVKLVDNEDDWKVGTCFVFKSNVYEYVISFVRDCVKDNPTNIRFYFIFDSMDSLVPEGDIERAFTEANKVAGGSVITSDFLRKMAVAFSSRGHICSLISQVRSTVKINQYEKTDPKITNASGGNAALHYSDWIFETQQRWNDDYIWAGEKGKSERLGHYCKIVFRKSPNEKTGKEIRYPIKYGRKNGDNVWVEYEIADQLIAWELASKKGAWLELSSVILNELADAKIDCPKQFNGINKLITFLEESPNTTKFLFKYFKTALEKVNSKNEMAEQIQ